MAKRTDRSLTPQIMIGELGDISSDQFPYSAQPMTNGRWSIYSYQEILATRIKNDMEQKEAEDMVRIWNSMFWRGAKEDATTFLYVKHD